MRREGRKSLTLFSPHAPPIAPLDTPVQFLLQRSDIGFAGGGIVAEYLHQLVVGGVVALEEDALPQALHGHGPGKKCSGNANESVGVLQVFRAIASGQLDLAHRARCGPVSFQRRHGAVDLLIAQSGLAQGKRGLNASIEVVAAQGVDEAADQVVAGGFRPAQQAPRRLQSKFRRRIVQALPEQDLGGIRP